MGEGGTNWAGNVTYSAGRLRSPQTVEQVQALVREARQVKVLGARHSFTDVADSSRPLLSLDAMEPVLLLDRQRHTATVNAGVRYGDLCRRLHREGYAVHNTASLPHISLAGACATGTHGSGDRNGNLATAVSGMELVTAGGDVRHPHPRARRGRTSRGRWWPWAPWAWSPRSPLTWCRRSRCARRCTRGCPWRSWRRTSTEVLSAAYSVSLFTDWQGDQIDQVWLKRRIEDGGPALGRTSSGRRRRRAPGTPWPATPRRRARRSWGSPGRGTTACPTSARSPPPARGRSCRASTSFPAGTPSRRCEPLTGMREQLAPLLQISEVRTVAADDLWLSPSYGQDSVALHFTWQPDGEGVRRLLPRLEERLDPLDARPHWGKLFATPAARLEALYPRLPDFRRLLQRYDPQGTFRNPFVERHLFGRPA